MYRGKGSAGWRTIGGKKNYYRSIWEANIARWLEWQRAHSLIVDWMHEPKTFWYEGIKRGCVSYKPDFWVLESDDRHYWIEVKGWFDHKSNTKIKRFRKYFPRENLMLVDKDWFRRNSAKLRLIIKDWEIGNAFKKGQIKICHFKKYFRDGTIRPSQGPGRRRLVGNG